MFGSLTGGHGLFGYALAFVCIITAIQLVCCADGESMACLGGGDLLVSRVQICISRTVMKGTDTCLRMVGTITISIASRATIDREAFFHFDYYCKQIANHSFTC